MDSVARLPGVVGVVLSVLNLCSIAGFISKAAADPHQLRCRSISMYCGCVLADVSETPPRAPVSDGDRVMQELLDSALGLAKDNPGRVEPLYVIGLVYQRNGNGDEASRYWAKCLGQNPQYADAYLSLAEVSFDRGLYERALALYRKGLSIYRRDPEIPVNIGKVLILLGRCDQAIETLEKHLNDYPHAAAAHIYLGKAYSLMKRYDKAREQFEKALQHYPEDETVHYGLAVACAKLGDIEKSSEHRQRFASLKSNSLSNLNEKFRTYDDVNLIKRNAAVGYIKIGVCYEICGNRQKAQVFLKKAVDLNAEDTEARPLLASLYHKDGHSREALGLYKELAAIEPGNPVNFMYIGSLNGELGQFQPAEAAFQKVIRMAPDRPEAYAALATLYIKTGRRLPEAKRLAVTLVRKKPTAQSYSILASACSANGDTFGARAAMEQANRLGRVN